MPETVLNNAQLTEAWKHLAARPSPSNCCLAIILNTGARPAEVLALRWGDWDGQATLTLPTAKRRSPHPRTALLNNTTRLMLQHHKKVSAKRRSTHPAELVFRGTRRGKSITSRSLRYAAVRLGRRIGLSHLRPYDLRHTFGTLSAAALGIGPTSELLGHKSPQSTMRYVHARQEDVIRAQTITSPTPETSPT